MKSIPDFITISRIILSLTLIYIKPLTLTFYTVYIICALTDAADGFIARKTGTESRFGAKLDSLADMIMAFVLLAVIYSIVILTSEIIIWIILIIIIRLASMTAAMIKYKTFASIHTYGNKIAGTFLFTFPIWLPFIHTTTLIYTTCFLATISAIEEFIIMITSKELQLNKKSIFIKN
jgi:CDP-diacylglycerol--glycerol-3-phosphate 3-phosphatidyltransferase